MICPELKNLQDKEQITGWSGLENIEEWRETANEYGVPFWDNENVLKLHNGDNWITL